MMVTHALGWALVDSLSQEALAGARLAALLALLPVRAARIRYALATLTLGLMLALPLASAVRLSGTSPWTDDVVTATSPVTPGPTSGPGPQAAPAAPTAAAPVAARIRAALEPALPWVVLVWFGGVVVLSLRLASGWLVTRQLGRVGTASVPDSCREAVARLAARLRISRPVRVLQSAVVQVEIFPRWMAGVIAVTIALGGGAHLASGTAATGDRGGTRPATLDSLIHRVEALRNPAARHEAVKTLGSRRDPRMVPPLLAIAQQDGDEEVQHEAVKALGKVRGGGGVGALLEIARTHPDPGVRRKAVKMVGEVATAEAALGVLERLAQRDPDVEVQQEAVEALGHLGSPQAIAPLARLARAQPNAEVRDEAVEQYARSAAPESALVLLVDRLANDSSPDVTVEAVARLADLPDGLGIPALREAARSHPSRHVRAEARRRLEDYR